MARIGSSVAYRRNAGRVESAGAPPAGRVALRGAFAPGRGGSGRGLARVSGASGRRRWRGYAERARHTHGRSQAVNRLTITLPPLAHPVDELWHVLLDLAETLRTPWTLVGGQMVLLHALEHGQVPPQISQDGDIVANVRAARDAIGQVVAALQTAGFTVDGMSPDGLQC